MTHLCPICRQTFTRQYSLQTHISHVHLGTRDFVCGVCGKAFKRNTHLRRHQKSQHSVGTASSSSSSSSTSAAATSPSLDRTRKRRHQSELSQPPPPPPLPPPPQPLPHQPSPLADHQSGSELGSEERSLESLPQDLKALCQRYWHSIKTHIRRGRYVTTLTSFWNPTHTSPQWDEILLDMFHTQTSRFKINYSHSFILKHKETGELSFYHASANNNAVLEHPILISSKPDFLSFLRSLNDHDILDAVQKQRPNSRFSVVAIPATSFYIYHMAEFPIGCSCEATLPSFIKDNNYVNTVISKKSDGLCFFRCLAIHQGAHRQYLETPANSLFQKWWITCHQTKSSTLGLFHTSSEHFSGVTLKDLERLESLFKLNIDVFIYEDIDRTPVLVPLRRSAYEYPVENTLRLLQYQQHFMYIIDIDKLGHALACPKCKRLWKSRCHLDRHERTCTGLGSVFRYTGGVFTPSKSILEQLYDFGITVDTGFVYPYRATFDFEVYFDTSDVPPPAAGTTYTARHIPMSVSVASNVDGYSEPVCFVNAGDPSKIVSDMINYLHEISDRASTLLHERFQSVFEELQEIEERQNSSVDHLNIPVKNLRNRFETYLNVLPVVGFNSSNYDLNVVKPYLIQALKTFVPGVSDDDDDDEQPPRKRSRFAQDDFFTIKRNNQFLCIGTSKLRFLDICNFLAPGFSYQKYLKAFGVTEMKSFFPYEYVTSLARLEETQLPPHEAFYSNLKKRNITEEEYKLCQTVWVENKMKTLKDFLIYYNNLDVKPFLCALDAQIHIYQDLGVDLLKDGLSVPGITLKYLFKTLGPRVYFSLFNKDQAELHSLLRDNLTGGPSIIFHRYHEKNKTYIRDNPNKSVQSIHGWDANALYLSGIMMDMPSEQPIVRRVENDFRSECRDRYGRLAREWLEYTAHTEGVDIRHKFNGRERQFGLRRIRVDGYDSLSHTIYQFHGCLWHGHDCHITRKYNGRNPYNNKTFEELRNNTEDITHYLRDTLKITVVEMHECQWIALKRRDDAIRQFIETHLAPLRYRYKLTEEGIISAVRSGNLFGLIKCDIIVPEHLREYFSEMQPIFKNVEIGRDDIGPHMKDYVEKHKLLSSPRRTLVGSYFAKQILLASPLLQWYLRHGLLVSNVTLVIEYKRNACFRDFGQAVSNARRAGDTDPSKSILAETFKLLGNSAYGRTISNVARHREISYFSSKNKDDVTKSINTIRFRKLVELNDDLVEVELAKKIINWNLPLQIGFFVYQYAKLRLLEFHYDFIDKYIDRSDYQLLECDTDSLYMALSASSLEELVRPELLHEFYDVWDHWFPSQACAAHKQDFKRAKVSGLSWSGIDCSNCKAQQLYDKRTPGLFKTEYSGNGFIGLCSKTYYCFGDDYDKVSSKGLNKSQNELTKEKYMSVLQNKKSGGGSNAGFRSIDGRSIISYLQHRKSLSYVYLKRIVDADGVTTYPTQV